MYINCTLIKKQKQKNIAQTNVKKLLPYVRERQISYNIIYMWNLKYDTDELIYKTETDSQTAKANLWLPKGERGGRRIN